MREGIDALLLLDEVLDVDLVLDVLYLGLSPVAVFVADGGELVLQDALYLLRVGEQALVVGYTLLELGVFALELFPVEALQGLQAHVEYGLGLHVVEAEAAHEVFLRVVIALAYDADDLVYVVLGYEQAFEEVGPLLGLFQVELRAADYELLLEGEVLVYYMPQG